MAISDEVKELFDANVQQIKENSRALMEELWISWSHLGLDYEAKVENITKLVKYHKDFHKEIFAETRKKVDKMQQDVDKLKKEMEELSQALSVDITSYDFTDGMMLADYQKELEEQISGYREQMEQRRSVINRLLEWQKDLTDKLGVTFQELPEVPLPSEDELEKLKAHLERLQAERDRRNEVFLKIQIDIKDIMDKLQLKPQNSFEQMAITTISANFKVTDLNMDRLRKLKQDYQDKYEQTNNRVLELRERLSRLWDCLEEDQIYRENFLQAHPGCYPDTEMAIREEIKRCDQIKRQKIAMVIANVRTKIKLMWDNVMYSQEQREEFMYYYQDTFTEDTLTLHEMYLNKISKFYEDNKHIFELIVERKNLWLKMTELEARATEPGRYNNRGGQLLREEKERKTIASKLPKIEAQIRDLVTEYENKTNSIFTVDGNPLKQMMEDDWEIRKAERHNKLSARKQALTPTPTTPLFRSMAKSPLGKRNHTAAGLTPADKTRPPTKRQLVTGSASKALGTLSSNLSSFKRTAVSTVKRRISGRLAARALHESKTDNAKRKLDYNTEITKGPKVNGHILKHKRTSNGRRRSGSSRKSINATQSTTESHDTRNPLDSTMLTTYTEFKEKIHEKQISRSSLANNPKGNEAPAIVCTVFQTPDKISTTPKKNIKSFKALGKENLPSTPKSNLLMTPTRLTRSAVKLDTDGFATPRTPFNLHLNVQKLTPNTVKTPTGMNRSKSHTNLVKAKNFPPII